MHTLTTNQLNALTVFHGAIEAESDFEWGDYFWMEDLLEMLTDNGWGRKAAEGTIGSLLDSGHSGVDAAYYDGNPCKNDKLEMLYAVTK